MISSVPRRRRLTLGGSGRATDHAVARSSELLSCARTALQLLQQSRPANGDSGSPNEPSYARLKTTDLRLHRLPDDDDDDVVDASLRDAVRIVELLDAELETLSGLVRRRGHTNDPTSEMERSMRRFQTCAKELSGLAESIVRSGAVGGGRQRARHYEYVANDLRNRGRERMETFKELMAMRGEVLQAQVRRRKLLESDGRKKKTTPSSGDGVTTRRIAVSSSSVAAASKRTSSQMNSPLFTMTSGAAATSSATNGGSNSRQRNGHDAVGPSPPSHGDKSNGSTSNSYGSSSYYGGSYNAGGYGGGGGYGGSDGMRRRNTSQQHHQQQTQNNYNYNNQQHQQQQQVYQSTSRHRVAEARQAEKSISELTKVFGKMANLVSAQEEMIENIEYDVEASMMQTESASKEIGILYETTKGNRGLIIKVFSILIFLIIFMRIY